MLTRFFPTLCGHVALLLLNGTGGLGWAQTDKAPAEPQAPGRAALLRVYLPLTGNADQAVQSALERIRDELLAQTRSHGDQRRPSIVLQLDPGNSATGDGRGSQFARAFALARFLCSSQMAGVKTVAFLPHSVRGHGTLLAMACEEIVMAPEAELGEAGVDESVEGTIRQTVVAAYREIAEARRTLPVALAVGMIDAQAEVLQVETESGLHFVLGSELEQFSDQREIIDSSTIVARGALANLTGREGRQFGFVKFLADDRAGLARALEVPVELLREDDQLAARWQPIMIDVVGKITPQLASRIETLLGSEMQQGDINWVGVRIDSAGGDLEAGLQLASTLAELDANSVRTIAYVPTEAAAEAAIVALACDQLVMHSTARLATRTALADDEPDRQADLAAAQITLREALAPQTPHGWSVFAAMLDPGIELFEYRDKTTGQQRLMSAEEVAELPDAANWQRGRPLQEAGQPLSLTGQRAQEAGLAWEEVESFDQLKRLYGFEADPPTVKPNWALELIEALASPELSMFLLMVGFLGIYMEIRTAGLGLGGFVATVAFLLFFWSKYLNGTAGWLEVLLFGAGFCCILLEIFVLPGFGIFGLGGGAMIIASLVLASLTFIRPHSQSDFEQLVSSVGQVALAGIGVAVMTTAARRYLPNAPLFRRMILAPPPPEEQILLDRREAIVDYSHLVGSHGVAHTDLRPSGRAKIEHELIDVVAEAEPLDRGTPIEVVAVQANRVVVRAAQA